MDVHQHNFKGGQWPIYTLQMLLAVFVATVRKCCVEAYNFYDHNDIVGYMVPLLGGRAINHIKVEFDGFSIFRLFNPKKYHTKYDTLETYPLATTH